MKKITLMAMLAIMTIFSWAQPTTYGVGAGAGGNITNSYFGASAGANNTAESNTFIGAYSGISNVSGIANTFLGDSSGSLNRWSYNTFIGSISGNHNTTGEVNTFVGAKSGRNNITGTGNTFLGASSGQSNGTGGNNTYIGRESGFSCLGSGNIFIGNQAGFTEVGSNLLYIDNSGTNLPLIWGNFSNNVLKVNGTLGVGLPLGNDPTEALDVIGTARLRAVPQDNALTRVLVTDLNGSVRWRDVSSLPVPAGDNMGNHMASQNITTNADGVYNIGSLASAFNDVFIGGSLFLDDQRFLHNSNNNVGLGESTLPAVTTGNQNVSIGDGSAPAVTTGTNNVALGYNALNFITTGSSNTAIGYDAGPGNIFQSGFNNTTAVGNQARSTASNQVRLGNSNVTNIGGYALWTNLSDKRFKDNIQEDHVPGLKFINELKTVTYEVNRKKLGEFLHERVADNSQPTKVKREAGLIAQEVNEVVTNGKYEFAGVYKPENEDHDTYGLQYEAFVAPLIKAVQELSAEVNALREELNALKSNQASDPNARGSSTILETTPNSSPVTRVTLEQNHPNPFDAVTTIRMNIPDETKSAFVVILDLRGEQIMSHVIQERGATSIQIEGKKLKPGMYFYSLVVNGEIADTKRMLVTD